MPNVQFSSTYKTPSGSCIAQELAIKAVQRTKHKQYGQKNSPSGAFSMHLSIQPTPEEHPGEAGAKQLKCHTAIFGDGFSCGLPLFLR